MIRLLQATLNNKEVRQNMEKEQKIRTWHQTVDFDSLMHEARKHITALAGKVWSDHNPSDPGITQLEVIAFCIADLSYRTSFDVRDILAGYKGNKQQPYDLPLADVALSNNPVTIKDLRKALIDMKHPDQVTDANSPNQLLVRNAFPVVWNASEIPFSAVTLDGNTNLEIRAHKRWDEIRLNGLYKIQIEFEDDLGQINGDELPNHLKDLNQNYFETTLTVQEQEFTISVLFPYWDEIDWRLKDALINPSIAYVKRDGGTEDYFIAVDKLSYDDYFYDYFARVKVGEHEIDASIKIKTKIRSSINIDGTELKFSANFLDWNELSNGVKRDYTGGSPYGLTLASNPIEVADVSIEGEPLMYDLRAQFSFSKPNSEGGVSEKIVHLLTRIEFEKGTTIVSDQFDLVAAALQNEFENLVNSKIELEEAIYQLMKNDGGGAGIYTTYQAKLEKVFGHLFNDYGIWSHLGQYRNVCEDFSKITASRVQEVALFGKLIVQPNCNVNEILAEIYFRIDQFLNPMVHFYSLSEMIEEGYQFTDLFNGPLLEHGFIKDEDLENLNGRSTIYTSDLIRIIMDVDGVKAVEDFSISNYIDNRLIARNVLNCLSLMSSDVYKPRFSGEKTVLKVVVNGKEEIADSAIAMEFYRTKIKAKKALQISSSDYVKLQLPLGKNRNIQDYRSIQHDFPEIYGIGEYGLPIDATEERKARAKQLKAFLLPIEQLLANYLKQVAHLPELFSYDRSVDSTYAFQPLYEVPDVQPLFEGFVRSNDTWENFKQDLSSSYEMAMREGESSDEFLDRRNRFLSQQLARFGESFANYSLHMLDRNKQLLNDPFQINTYLEKRAETLEQLIDDKISFAEDYQKLSGARFNAFNTTWDSKELVELWENDNISSYKLRLCRLLGIKNIDNQFLFGTGTGGEDLEGMHIVEHILLRPYFSTDELLTIPNRITESRESFVYDSDLDPYSLKLTIVLPLTAGRFVDEQFRAFVEQLIRYETPAHIVVYFKWMTTECGIEFEKNYSWWKKNVFLMNPSFFQRNHPDSHYEINFDEEPFQVIADLQGTEESFFEIRNRLIKTLNESCPPVEEEIEPEEESIYIKLFENGVEMSQPFVLNSLDESKEYHIEFHPGDATRYARVFKNESYMEFINPIAVGQDHYREELFVKDLFNLKGVGPYKHVISKNGESIELLFSILGPSPILPEMKLYQGEEELTVEPYKLYADEGNYRIELNEVGGIFSIHSPESNMVFGGTVKTVDDLNQSIPLDFLMTKSSANPFRAQYAINKELTWFYFDILPHNPSTDPHPLHVLVIDVLDQSEVDYVEDIHQIVFNYQQPKQRVQFEFSQYPGVFTFVNQDGQVKEYPLSTGVRMFNSFSLPDGDYQAKYITNTGNELNFAFIVTSLNPTFKLEEIVQFKGGYTAIGTPLYPDAKVYVWELNDQFLTQKRNPKITFDFQSTKQAVLRLTMHKNDTEASFEMVVTKEFLDNLSKSGLNG